MRKTIFTILTLITALSFSPSVIHASDSPYSATTSKYEGGYYIETIITDATPNIQPPSTYATYKSTAKTKTTYIKDANGNVLWYVSITGTFTYDGSTSRCVNCSHRAVAQSSAWKIKNSSSDRSGNTATATATAMYISSMGVTTDYTKSVTIQCSPTGVIS